MNFFNQTLLAAGGVLLSQLINFAATPLLARLYEPHQFGLFAIFIAITESVAGIACLRFDVALGVAKDDEVPSMMSLALAISGIIAFFSVIGLYFFGDIVSLIAKLEGAKFWLSFSIITNAIIQIFTILGIRQGDFILNSSLRISQTLFYIAIAAFLPVLGLIGASALSGLVWIWGFKIRIPLLVSAGSCKQLWLSLLKRYRNYPLYSAPTAVLDNLSLSAPVFIINYFFGDAATGNYAQVQRVIAAPLLLLTVAIGQVFFNRLVIFQRLGQDSRPLMWKIVCALFGLGAIVLCMIGLVGQPVMTLLLGSHWRVDTWFLLVIICPVAIRMCVSPVTSIFLVENKIRALALWQVTYFIAAFGILPYFAARLSLDQFLEVLIINEFFLYIFYLGLCDWVARRGKPFFINNQ